MAGVPIASMTQGIRMLHSNLMGDPSAVESAYLSVISFGQDCRQIAPLVELDKFVPPPLQAQSNFDSCLGDALRLLRNCISYEVRPPTAGDKGDWKPLVFLLTHSPITDEQEYHRWAAEFRQRRPCNLVAVVGGRDPDAVQLGLLTDTVLIMKDMSPDAFGQFFKWVSQSVPVPV